MKSLLIVAIMSGLLVFGTYANRSVNPVKPKVLVGYKIK